MKNRDKKYFIKLIVLTALAQFGITIAAVSMFINYQTYQIDKSAAFLKTFNEKLIKEDSSLQDFFKLLQMKHNLDSQDGVGAEIVPKNKIKK